MDLMTLSRVRKTGDFGPGRGAAGQAARDAKEPFLRLGSGPWLIVPECPSVTGHNTMKAARADGALRMRCICPRSLVLMEERRQRERGVKRRRAELRRLNALGERARADLLKQMTTLVGHYGSVFETMPDLSGAACTTPFGQEMAAEAFNSERGPTAAHASNAMKAVCNTCPGATKVACGAWALAKEDPAGEWGGVYGGMTATERRKIREKMSAEQATNLLLELEGVKHE